MRSRKQPRRSPSSPIRNGCGSSVTRIGGEPISGRSGICLVNFAIEKVVAAAGACMAEHEPSIGATSDWYTPPEIFKALDLVFDLDPCSPGPGHWVPARRIYTKEDDGLRQQIGRAHV